MKTEPPTLAILIPGFPKDENDSTCLPAQQSFIRAFNKEFPTIKVIIFSFQYPFTAGEYTWHGNRVIAFGGKNKGGITKFILREKIMSALNDLFGKITIIGVLSFWAGECALLGNHFSKKNTVPHFIWIMGQDAKKENQFIKKIKPIEDELIAISDTIRETFFKNHGVSPQWVIPLGMESLGVHENTHRDIDILCAGSQIPLKRFELAIEIIKSLKNTLPKINAIICGNGPERKRLQSIILQADLQDTISLPGEIPHEELLQLMCKSKILLHPSSYEGFSGVCLEALSAGMQVISFSQPMKHEIENWHIVNSTEEMNTLSHELLTSHLTYKPTLPFLMEHTVKDIGKLLRVEC